MTFLPPFVPVSSAEIIPGRSVVASRYGIVAASQPLAAAAGVRILDAGGNAVDAAIARRMGVPVTHPGVRIAFDTWAVLMAVACGTPGTDASDPRTISDRIETTYEIFTRLWRPWRSPEQPPAGEPGT